jgi:hypothetical protein
VGIYLGLDTLNVRDGRGTNIDFGGTPNCDPNQDSADWVWEADLEYGKPHLIQGLYRLQDAYRTEPWREAFQLLDYIFFLGYSGIILCSAFEKLSPPRDLLPAWGFHDGDMFTLGRMRVGTFSRICI